MTKAEAQDVTGKTRLTRAWQVGALLLVALVMVILASPAAAQAATSDKGIVPVPLPRGNYAGEGATVCNNTDINKTGETWLGVKVDPSVSGTFDGFVITLSVVDGNEFLAWDGTGTTNVMKAVLVKPGDVSYAYYYNPPFEPPNSTIYRSDSGLSGVQQDISHYVLCYVEAEDEPDVTITKTPSVTDVCTGANTSVTYTYVVTNTGNVALDGSVVDDNGTPADTTDDVTVGTFSDLAPSGTASFTQTVTLTGTTTNTATVTATTAADETVTDSASATVTGRTCTISLTKTPSTTDVCTDANTSVTYTYVVTNTGDFFSASGSISDDVLGSIGSFGPLAPGASATLTKVATINATTTNTGTATATFTDSAGTTATATATATVTARACTISLTKTPDVTEVCIGADTSVTYTYVVTNNSGFTWTGTLTDSVLGAINGTITLAPGASQTLTASGIVNDTTTNTATATGTFDDTDTTTANATATATVTGTICGEDGEGCTPGYWRQEHHFDSWVATGYSPSDTLDSVFTFPASLTTLEDATLVEALEFQGGKGLEGAAEILLRAAVAALLNAAHPDIDYPMTTAEVIAAVNAALASEDRGTMLTLAETLDEFNNLGCPLD